MQNNKLTAQNAYLTQMLKQAGLDAEARDVAERIQAVLTDEIHHRMKNMLTMVTAIVRQSMRSAQGLAEAGAAISVRLLAMARAHDLLLKADWQSAGLLAVVRGAVEQHETAAARIMVSGDDMQITSATILPLTMILNELCTNATKYGALSRESGHVEIGWTMVDGALVLRWLEGGGPPVGAPERRNFGSKLIENALPRQLGGSGHLEFLPSGVTFTLTLPLARLQPVFETASEPAPA